MSWNIVTSYSICYLLLFLTGNDDGDNNKTATTIMMAMTTRRQHKEKWQPARTDKRQMTTITTIASWSSLPLAEGEERQRGKNMRRRWWRRQWRRWQQWRKWQPKNQFQIYFLPTPEQKRHQNLFRMRPGNKAALLVPWCTRCNRVETGIDY